MLYMRRLGRTTVFLVTIPHSDTRDHVLPLDVAVGQLGADNSTLVVLVTSSAGLYTEIIDKRVLITIFLSQATVTAQHHNINKHIITTFSTMEYSTVRHTQKTNVHNVKIFLTCHIVILFFELPKN